MRNSTQLVERICRIIESQPEEALTLGELASRAGLSPFHLQRSFKAVVGLTPKQYQQACRLKKLKGELRSGSSATRAIFEAGYGSVSRVYEKADAGLGMTPIEYRNGGKDLRISYVSVNGPLGLMMLGATDRGICFLQFGDTKLQLLEALRQEYPQAHLDRMPSPYPEQFELWMAALSAYLEGHQPHLDLPLEVRATAFQMKVWRYLQRIPYGEVRTYTQVAKGIGQPSAVRAVASACAANTVAIAIPCHRVIRGDGSLGGYRWGLDRKRALIESEKNV